MVPAETLRPSLAGIHPRLTVRFLAAGGHVAFPSRADAGLGAEAGVEEQVIGWLLRQSGG